MAIEAIQSLIISYPKTSIIAFGLIVSFFISLVNYFVLDKARMHEIKKRQKEIQDEIKKHKDNPSKQMELQKELMGHMGETFRHSFKPMLITMIPLLVFFWWLKGAFAPTAIAKTWIWYYIGTSIFGSMFFRKILKLP